MKDDYDKQLLEALFEFGNKILYLAAQQEIAGYDILPEAIGHILIFGDAILPGCIVGIIQNDSLDVRTAIRETLEKEKLLSCDPVKSWFENSALDFPMLAAYVIHLDHVRHVAIMILSAPGA